MPKNSIVLYIYTLIFLNYENSNFRYAQADD